MRDQELERLFDRFRRAGDVQALGALFDATAPELLRVAMSLVRDPGEADDLLQETFLSAIERAARYDAERRLVPWLLGILVHHAQERRRLRRRELDRERVHTPTQAAPEAQVLGHELEQALERALGELSARERGVLEAYLRQGKGAAEIAGETGAAPGAVRMQIHRGLDRLRKALPIGLALGTAGASSAQGLTAVRDAVLRAGRTAAKTLAPGAGSALVGTTAGVLMGKKLILAGILAALVAGLFWLRGSEGGPRVGVGAGAEVARAQTPPPSQADEAGLRLSPAQGAAQPAAAVPAPRRPSSAGGTLDADRAGLRGRVVEHDGTPVAGLTVALLQLEESELFPPALGALEGPPTLPLLAGSARTDEQGVFVLQGARARALHALGLDLGGARASLRVLDAQLAPGTTSDLGEVVLAAGGALSGRVVDEQGRGLAGARVRVGILAETILQLGLDRLEAGGAFGELQSSGEAEFLFELPAWLSALEERLPLATVRTDADGRFELAQVAAGRLTVLVDAAGHARLTSEPFTLAAQGRAALGDLVLAAGESLRVRVLEQDGSPAGAAEVRASKRAEGQRLAVFGPAARCDAAGAHTFEHLPQSGEAAVLARRDAEGSWVAARAEGGEFVARLPARRELVVEVLDGDGAAVPAPEFFLRRVTQADAMGVFAPALAPRKGRALSEAGRWALGALEEGAYLLVARSADHGQASLELRLGPAEAGVTRVVLAAPARVEVLVRDAATGAPVAGAEVRFEQGTGARAPALVSAQSDAQGRAVLALPAAGAEALWLRVEHARFAPFEGRFDGARTVTVELGAGAVLAARLVDPLLAGQRCMLQLFFHGTGERQVVHLPRLLGFPPTGELRIPLLPPGKWSYSLLESLSAGEALAFLDPTAAPQSFLQGEFELREGQTFELLLGDEQPGAAAAGLAVLNGTVRVDGRLVRAMDVNLVPLLERDNGRHAYGASLYREGQSGRFRFEDLDPGRYMLFVSTQSGALTSGSTDLVQAELVLAPGESRELDYDIQVQALSVRVLDASGAPAAEAQVRIYPTQPRGGHADGVTDKNGLVDLQVAGTGRHRLLATEPLLGAVSRELELGAEKELTLTLAKGVECAGTVRVDPAAPREQDWAWLEAHSVDDPWFEVRARVELVGDRAPFRLVGLPPGRYQAWAWFGGDQGLGGSFELPEWGAGALELDFRGGDTDG